MKRCVLSLARKVGEEFEFRVSVNSVVVDQFIGRGPMTEKAFSLSGMERTSESEDLAETECDGNERLLLRCVSVLYVRRQIL